MDDKTVKEGYKLAEEELREEEKQKIKSVVKATLEKLKKKEEQKRELEEEIKILRRDIDDLKEGRIDRIKERQDIDPKAKSVSVIIIKERVIKEYVSSPWYVPWVIEFKKYEDPYLPTLLYNETSTTAAWRGYHTIGATTSNAEVVSFTTNNSAAHTYTSGTYLLDDGTVKHL